MRRAPEEAMKKPTTLIYGVDETPPLMITVLSGFQHAGIIAINLIYPVVVYRVAGASTALVATLLSMGMWVLAIGTLIQSSRRIGSGYMCPSTFTATYLAPSLL